MSVLMHQHDSVTSSPSGMAYELVLKPAAENARRPEVTPSPGRRLSSDILRQKLLAAAERKKMHQQDVIAKMNEETAKIKKARRVLIESEEQFKSTSGSLWQQKLAASNENLVAIREAKRARLNKMLQKVEDARIKREEMVLAKSRLVEEKVERRIEGMRENREAILAAMVTRLQAHDQYVAEIHRTMTKRGSGHSGEEKLKQELEAAETRREDAVNEMLESIPTHCCGENAE